MKSINDKIRLNNGYEIPCYYIGPSHPAWSDKAKNDGKVDGSGFATVDVCGATIEDVMRTALECGVRGFDTGARYGTEEDIGRFFRTCGLPREELFVTTKVNNKMQGYDNTMIDFDASMKKLGLDYVDVYMIHCPVPQRGLYVDTWRAFEEIYRSGRAKAIAVSNFNVQHFYDLAEVSDIVPAINQIEQHPFYVQENLKAYEKSMELSLCLTVRLGRAVSPRIRALSGLQKNTARVSRRSSCAGICRRASSRSPVPRIQSA